MNRYQLKNSVEKVDGYFFPTPHQRLGGSGGLEAAFNTAKSETMVHLQAQIENIRTLTFQQFATEKKITPHRKTGQEEEK